MRHFDWLAIKRTVDSLGKAARLAEQRIGLLLWHRSDEGRIIRLAELAKRLQVLIIQLDRPGRHRLWPLLNGSTASAVTYSTGWAGLD